MGKGDQKTRRGKIVRGSFGRTRPQNPLRAKAKAAVHTVEVDEKKATSELKAKEKAVTGEVKEEIKKAPKPAPEKKTETEKAEKKEKKSTKKETKAE